MKILLLHSEDDPEKGPWSNLPWDHIVDLGLGGANSFARWSDKFQCPVTTLGSLRNGFDVFRRVRDLLGLGSGKLLDEHGLDWWELMSILLHGELETLILLQRLLHTLGSEDEVYLSRPGLHANLLRGLLTPRVKVFPLRPVAQKSGLAYYVRVLRKLSAAQTVDVFWDKYDLGYQFRARLVSRRAPSQRPVVLVPTAYVNVSRTGLAYANTFQQENFLLVATRRSGWLKDLTKNMAAAWLSSYASLRDRSDENVEIAGRWRTLRKELEGTPEFEILSRLGYLDIFARWLRHGLEVRDAWRNVLDTEPVQAVLCCDDSNPYTRMPMLLAQARGLPNIACHHGALDGRYVFKRTYGDVVWAKGKMEEDYLVRRCGVPRERVEIAAPALPASWGASQVSNRQRSQPHLLFLSEVFEAGGGRAEDFYRDVVPPLADLALATGRQLIVKLHPGESTRERTNILARILSARQKGVMRIISGPLTEDLLAKAWFGITILSTVAVECAIRGIPCFLCKWLESWPYGYVEQFIRYGVGIGLDKPSDIAKISQYLQANPAGADVRENCWQPAAAGRLRQLLTTSCKAYTTVAR